MLVAVAGLTGCFGLEEAQKRKVREQVLARLAQKGCPVYLSREKRTPRPVRWRALPEKRPSAAAHDALVRGAKPERSMLSRVLLVGAPGPPLGGGAARGDAVYRTVKRLLTDYGVPHHGVVVGHERLPQLVERRIGRYAATLLSSSRLVHPHRRRAGPVRDGPPSSTSPHRRQARRAVRVERPLLGPRERRRLRAYHRRFGVREVTLSLAGSVPRLGLRVTRTLRVDPGAPPTPVDRGPSVRLTRLGRRLLPALPRGFRSRLGPERTRLVRVGPPARTIMSSARGSLAALVGRDRLVLTWDQDAQELTTLATFPAVLAWATRGVFIGERRPVLVPQVDDLLLPNFEHGGGEYRMSPADWRAAERWVRRVRRGPLTPELTIDWAFNGLRAARCDPLTRTAIGGRQLFHWTNHTFEHLNLDDESEQETFSQVVFNDRVAKRLRLPGYDPRVLVTGEHSGLANRDAMLGARRAGAAVVAWDLTRPVDGKADLRFNELLPNPELPDVMMVPRSPTNLFNNVGTPGQWTDAYNDVYSHFWRRDLPLRLVVAAVSRQVVAALLRGAWAPLFLHQINLRAYDGRRSLLTDLLDRVIADYRMRAREPLATPTFAGVARMMRRRMEFARCHPEGIVEVDRRGLPARLRIVAGQHCHVPVTGPSPAAARDVPAGPTPRAVRLPH